MTDVPGLDVPALRRLIRDIPDFPDPGVVFRDITPLLADGNGLAAAIDHLAEPLTERGITHVVGIEARGFLLAVPVALRLGAGFVPARKPGKLPGSTHRQDYDLEYGTDSLEVHVDALGPDHRVVIVDDVLATGGTAAATAALVRSTGADLVGVSVLIELEPLGGRLRLPGESVRSVITYSAGD